MSQYLSHLANLAFDRLDVVQPRLSSRFENQDGAAASGFNPQDRFYEPAASAIGPAASHAQVKTEPAKSPPPEIDSAYTDKAIILRQLALSARNVPAALSVDRKSSDSNSIEPGTERVKSLQNETTDLSLLEPKTPELMPAPTTTKTKAPAFKEEVAETQLHLLSSDSVNSKFARASIFVSPLATTSVDFARESPQMENTERNRSQVQANQRVTRPEPAAKSPVRPDSIRIKPAESDFIKEASTFIKEASTKSRVLPATPIEVTPPSIHVSIGRIEIRANQTSAPVAASKARQPSTMSLDDCMKRKGERP